MRQQANDLTQEERVTLGLRVDRIDKAGGNVGSRSQSDELGDIVSRESGERERARDGFATQRDERQTQRVAACELGVAVAGDDEDASLGELAGEELQ